MVAEQRFHFRQVSL